LALDLQLTLGAFMSSSVDGLILRHFGLAENPFGVTPDPRFLYMSRTHREALASLVNGIECGFGFQVLVAQPGMGKTTLLFDFLERFNGSRTAFLFQQQQDPRDFLQSLLMELKSDSTETSQAKLYGKLNQILSEAALTRKRVIVVVDEAQNLDDTLLETLRQLSNFETARSKLLQIVLAGQPQLAKKLARPEQEQLRQRISTIARLSPLGLDETRTYLNHRLDIAGYRGPQLFTKTALYLIWSRSNGIPRNINTLCFNAMLVTFAQKAKQVDEHAIKEASQDLDLDFVLADIAGAHPPANETGDCVLTSELEPPEKKPSHSIKPAIAQVPSNGRGLSVADSVTKPSVKWEPEFAGIIGSDRRSNAETTQLGNHRQPVVQSSGSNGRPPATVETAPASAGLATARPATFSNQQKPVTPRPVVAAMALNPPSRTPVAAASTRSHRSVGRKVVGTLLVAAAVGAGVLFGHGLGTRAQRQYEESSEQPLHSHAAADQQPVVEGPMVQPSKKKHGEWSEEDGPEVVVRTFPRSTSLSTDGSAQTDVKAIFFEGDSSTVPSQYDMALQRIAETLAANPQSNAILEGHTDNSGEEPYNLELSTRRARAVKDMLVNDYQIDPERLNTVGVGSSGPIESNSTSSGRAYNRRVEVRIHQGKE
jgi:type II secretory pathway predicted ATPase ExeA/outer membrane protein OmpA-like peptidoglycan-associated protein